MLVSAARDFHERLKIARDKVFTIFTQSDVAFFHDFAPPPIGGGHQFLRALWQEFKRRGIRVDNNRIANNTRACLFNSFNFNFQRLRAFHRPTCHMVHRVDGPLNTYRGFDDGTDRRIWEINQEFADATVFQSQYSLDKHSELGYKFRKPYIIMNAADPKIFYPKKRMPYDHVRKLKLISCSWSDNPNKGVAIYEWLDRHLDWERYEYTFVGRISAKFEHIRHVPPLDSYALADLLRCSDIFITASRNDPCSNSLIEALACGLPAIYLNSGGHKKIVGEAGLPFVSVEEIPNQLKEMAEHLEVYQNKIVTPSITDVASRYLSVLHIEPAESA